MSARFPRSIFVSETELEILRLSLRLSRIVCAPEPWLIHSPLEQQPRELIDLLLRTGPLILTIKPVPILANRVALGRIRPYWLDGPMFTECEVQLLREYMDDSERARLDQFMDTETEILHLWQKQRSNGI